MIEVELVNRSGAEVDEAAAVALARWVLAGEGVAAGELGLAFVGSAESRALKREHLGVDEATDALAFPIDGLGAVPDGLPRQLGDVVVCPDVVGEEWRVYASTIRCTSLCRTTSRWLKWTNSMPSIEPRMSCT